MNLKWLIRSAAVLTVFGLTIVATHADEAEVSLKARLSGFQEVTPKLTDGTGSFRASVNGSTLSYTLTFSGLSSPAFMSHIHFGQPAVNGGIFLWLCGSASAPGPAGTPACPAGGGTVSRSGVTAADIQGIALQNVGAGDFAGALRIIESGTSYVNVHTTNFPGGEIRGTVRTDD